jgi:phosphatidylserine/phosphatidylglycerophosphate/cardiolipin synthase-like enzyme
VQEAFWPRDLPVHFENIRAGIARTLAPSTTQSTAVREIEAFYLAAIGATQHQLYLENQYFTSSAVAAAIADRCKRRPKMEGLLVGMERPKTQIELHTMGYGLQEFRQQLEDAGCSKRLAMVSAFSGERGINMHSKIGVFDDRWLTAGSANLNRRSMGFDVECNLVLEATRLEHRVQIERLRNRLLAEHLAASEEEIRTGIREHGLVSLPSIFHARRRRLVPLSPLRPEPVFGPVLAPLFDRDDPWLPPVRASSTSVPKYVPLLFMLMVFAAFAGSFGSDDLPTFTELERAIERMLNS